MNDDLTPMTAANSGDSDQAPAPDHSAPQTRTPSTRTPSDRNRHTHGRRLLPLVLLIAFVVLLIDQGSKLWAERTLPGHNPIPVIGDFIQLRLVYNPGAAFSIGSGSTWIFAVLAAVAVVALMWFAVYVESRGWAIAIGMLLGGATTHLLDRLLRAPGFGRGHVVDFIAYDGWFVGNIADIMLAVGAILLVTLTLRGIDYK